MLKFVKFSATVVPKAKYHTQYDVVGSVEAGIECSSWSSDQALLSIVTGAHLDYTLS